MDGLILLDKPAGATSHDVVARLRRILGQQKVGHFGTLDPLATGLLLVAAGRAVRLFPYYSKTDKAYSGEIRLGFSTDTYDALGLPSSPPAASLPDRQNVAAAMRRLVGRIDQVPPPYSAKKLRGKPLYKWARARAVVSPRPVPVSVYSFDLTDYAPPLVSFVVACGSGTYVRSLAHELGQSLGCGGHLYALRRLAVGSHALAEAHSLAEVEELAGQGKAERFLIPLEGLLPELPKAVLSEAGWRRLQHSGVLESGDILELSEAPAATSGAGGIPGGLLYRLFNGQGRFIGLAEPRPGSAELRVRLRLG